MKVVAKHIRGKAQKSSLKRNKTNAIPAMLAVLDKASVPHCPDRLRQKLRRSGLDFQAGDLYIWAMQLCEQGMISCATFKDYPDRRYSDWTTKFMPAQGMALELQP